MVHAMRCEFSLPSIKHKIREVNTVSAVRHLRTQSGIQLYDRVRAARHKGAYQGQRNDYLSKLVTNLQEHNISDADISSAKIETQVPWEDGRFEVIIKQLPYKKLQGNLKCTTS